MLWNKLQRWGYRRHPNKSKTWVNNKYWGTIGKNNWMFKTKEGNYLPKHAKTKIVRHTKIKGVWLFWKDVWSGLERYRKSRRSSSRAASLN
ncbi:hypothetical protein BJP37_06310 [Moorena bouillonii PNG]|uniref:Group II intron maturase-specific domain-containing protein n=2 Tax=Coleofasciculaceae TaxID=1892251 RepID=A0A1U7MYI4_9CYAN|nr:hypothetical protein BJP37_06310 [Moorena bouillonii PNG]